VTGRRLDDALNPDDLYKPEELVDEVKELIRFAILVNEEIQDSLIGGDDRRLQRQEDEASINPFSADRPIHKRRWSFMPLQRQDEASVIQASTEDPVRKQGDAFTLYLAKMAAEDSIVKQFPRRSCSGRSRCRRTSNIRLFLPITIA